MFPRACYSQLLIVSTKLRRICPLMYPSKSMLVHLFFQPNCNFPLQHPTSTMLIEGGIIEAKRNDIVTNRNSKDLWLLGALFHWLLGTSICNYVSLVHGGEGGQ